MPRLRLASGRDPAFVHGMIPGTATPSGISAVTPDWLTPWLAAQGQPAYRANQILDWIYKKRVNRWGAMLNLPQGVRKGLAAAVPEGGMSVVRMLGSHDTTRKFLLKLSDGRLIESVLIPASPALYGEPADRLTLCVSSQVGCAYGCKFCASGLAGWMRHLTPAEIVGQILTVERETGEIVNNLVFMGMGEPLANYANLMESLTILNSEWGLKIGARHITISTSGLAPAIRQLADQPVAFRLAISLHGATDRVRERIMPVNRKYPLDTLLEACQYYRETKRQMITLEYILIEGINAGLDDATALARWARQLRAKVNLIPYNQVEGLEWTRPGEADQEKFLMVLKRAGVRATLRREKGHDISAACGQLRLQTEVQKDALFAGQMGLRSGVREYSHA